ncbi:MAG: neutral/alkaline non-lysosomal ceramidase N-terminal domain-containing protein [Brevinema sp.]
MEAIIGFFKTKITPTKPVPLIGYNVNRKSQGIHDDLFIRTVVFSLDKKHVALIQMDLLCVDEEFVDRVKKHIKPLGIDHVFISTTHTHSAPGGIINTQKGFLHGQQSTFGKIDHTVIKCYLEKITICIQESLRNASAGQIEYLHGVLPDGVCSNRNEMIREIDHSLDLIKIDFDDKRTLLLYNFACHPTILNHENFFMSAEFPGYISHHLENKNLCSLSIFFNGSCGDISTRFTKKSATFSEIERLGDMIINSIQILLKKSKKREYLSILKTKEKKYSLSTKNLDPLPIAQAKLKQVTKDWLEAEQNPLLSRIEKRIIQSYREGAQSNLSLTERFQGISSITIPVSILILNQLNIIFLPTETYSLLSKGIKKKYPNTLFFGFSNGYAGYLPDAEAYQTENYEVLSSPYKKGVGEQLMQYIENLIMGDQK